MTAVPDGIVERKDLKVILAPPWGINYEMKAKKNDKKLSYFHNERKPSDNRPFSLSADTNRVNSLPKPVGVSEEENVDIAKLEDVKHQYEEGSEYHHNIDVPDDSSEKTVEKKESTDTEQNLVESGLRTDREVTARQHTLPSMIAPYSTSADEVPPVRHKKQVKLLEDLRPELSGRETYATSNSVYGLHQTESSENMQSYRRSSTFSRLYGDKQYGKK